MDDFNALEANIKSALVSTIRSANSLGSEDLAFHRSLDSTVGSTLDQQNARLVGLAERLVGAATANTEIVRPPRLRNLEAVEDNWKAVVDVVDSLLERADTALDEFTGAVKRLSPGVDQTATLKQAKPSKIGAALKTQNLEKPQLLFEYVPKNNETGPFRPLLQSKPHASAPLENSPIASDSESQFTYPHPYQLEIEQYRYPSSVYTHSEPIVYPPFEATSAILVDTEEALDEMLEELKQAKEIAVDLEHHDNRSYIGIVSLMQISTRGKDWIVDTLKPWRRKLQCLNEVFANPNILKVLHGAYMDIVWLQRDLGLYIVGLFDSHHASRVLGYPGGSLAFLLKKFVNFDAQKQYQMADWRIRPLPQELLNYARSDTHFLLYIYDNMRNDLIAKSDFSQPNHEGDKLWDVLQKSSECALQRYEHPHYDADYGLGSKGWYSLLSKTPALLTKEQFSVFRAVHRWRDDIAREQDDSLHFVMPNHHIFSLAKAMPSNRQALFAVATPATQTVRLRADELVSVIVKAKEAGKDGPEMMELFHEIDPQIHRKHITTDNMTPKTVTTAPAQNAGSQIAGGQSGLPIRAPASRFWGSTFESSSWNQRRASSTSAQISLAVPLPPLTAEIFADPTEIARDDFKRQSPDPIPTPIQSTDEDDVFVLKELNRKRKRIEPMDGMAANSDEVAIPDERADAARAKAERKAAKRAAKKAAKDGAAPGSGENSLLDDEAPFDYASAPSILNPPRESKDTAKERKKREKQLNPYAKAMDAPKGLPRVQKEKPGKSMTFKS